MNGDSPVHPCRVWKWNELQSYEIELTGLTKREHIATLALSAIIGKLPVEESPSERKYISAALGARNYADALLKVLGEKS